MTRRAFTLALCVAVLLAFVAQGLLLAVDGKKAMYVGGTRTDIKEAAEGAFDVSGGTEIAFMPDKTKVRHTIAYKDVTALEYGQKAGRRVAVALLVSPVALFSHKRNHYLTISFKDADGKDQAGVFELGKDIVRLNSVTGVGSLIRVVLRRSGTIPTVESRRSHTHGR